MMARRVVGIRRTWPGAGVTLVALAALAGCSGTGGAVPSRPVAARSAPGGPVKPTDSQFNGIEGVRQEYLAASRKYQLPAGYTYPASPFDDTSGSYQEGYGASQAVHVWNCSWGKEFLKYKGQDQKRSAAALETYAAVRNTDTYRRFWDPQSMQVPFEASIQAAQLGDPSAIEKDIEANCS
jgi:hypothetical protein